MQFSDAFRRWMSQHGAGYLQPILAAVHQQPVDFVRGSAAYHQHVVAEAVDAAPLQLRLADPTYAQIAGFLLEARDQLFDARGRTALLREDWTQVVTQFSTIAGTPAIPVAPAIQPNTTPSAERQEEPAVVSPAGGADVCSAPVAAPAADIPVGIDLGTTYSVIAHLDAQGRPISIANSSGDLLTPSVVLFDDDGIVVGKEAVMAAALEPDRVADCVKRDMGSKHYRKAIRGEFLPPEVISSLILRKLKQDAELKLGPVTKAVITVPAYFDETRRRATMDAGRLAGLDVLDIINEPTAAAVAYGYQAGYLDSEGKVKGDRPIRILVYDLGGGTFDVTIVEMSCQTFKAVATDGDVRLGGKDWDEKLIDLMAEAFRLAHCADPRASAETMQDLWKTAETVKRTLSERSKATAILNHEATRFKMEVTRQQFEEATAPLVLRTRTTTEIVLLQAGLNWSDIDKVLLVGGSTRMPMIVQMISELSGKQPERSVAVDEAVAHGAALYADLLLKRRGLGPGHTDFTVTNINSHSLGVAGLDPRTRRRVTTVLIPKNTPLPHTARRRFRTAKAGQTAVQISVLEGESEYPEACVEVGVAVVRGLPANLPAGWPVEVCYSYGEGGRLQVTGQLIGHGAGVTVEFARDNSLSDDDLLLWAECLKAEAARQSTGSASESSSRSVPQDPARGLFTANVGALPSAPARALPSDKALRVLRGEKIYGPMTRDQVIQLLSDGRLKSSDLVCAIDSPWTPLANFLAPAAQAVVTAVPVPAVPASFAAKPPVTTPPAMPGRGPSPLTTVVAVPQPVPAPAAQPAPTPAAPAKEAELFELGLADLDEQDQPEMDLVSPQLLPTSPLISHSLLDDLEDQAPVLSTDPEWFIKIRGMTACQLSMAQLKSLVVAREVHADSPVANIHWGEGVWRPFRNVQELAHLWKFLPE